MGKRSWDETIVKGVKGVSFESHLNLLLRENNGT